MPKGFEWGLWIAGLGLLVAAAKFLDEYHIKVHTKSATRDALVRAFIFLDQPRVLNVPAEIYHRVSVGISRRLGPFGWLIFWIGCYFAVVTAFYLGRRVLEPDWDYPFPTYALTWVDSAFWAAFMLFAVGTSTATYLLAGVLTRRWNGSGTLLGQATFMLLTLGLFLVAAVITGIGFFVFGIINHNSALPIATGSGIGLGNPIFLLTLTVLCLWHLVFISAAMVFLTLFRATYIVSHKAISSVLDAASNPKVSPYQYLATMLALLGLGFKVIDELLK